MLIAAQLAARAHSDDNRAPRLAGFVGARIRVSRPDATASNACGSRISNLALNGTPIGMSTTYRVTMNNFLATGGDGFTVFNEGTEALGGAQDIDALVAYFGANSPIAVPPLNRITTLP
jgi:2',3'-cyclic-nucleotide 2'-phosphodiesterase (5'-nucleotidase family)